MGELEPAHVRNLRHDIKDAAKGARVGLFVTGVAILLTENSRDMGSSEQPYPFEDVLPTINAVGALGAGLTTLGFVGKYAFRRFQLRRAIQQETSEQPPLA